MTVRFAVGVIQNCFFPIDNVQYNSRPSLQSHSCSRTGLETSQRKLTIFTRVRTRAMHVKIFTACLEYLSIETRAIVVLSSKR